MMSDSVGVNNHCVLLPLRADLGSLSSTAGRSVTSTGSTAATVASTVDSPVALLSQRDWLLDTTVSSGELPSVLNVSSVSDISSVASSVGDSFSTVPAGSPACDSGSCVDRSVDKLSHQWLDQPQLQQQQQPVATSLNLTLNGSRDESVVSLRRQSLSELSFTTADSSATSVYASADEQSPDRPTPPTCVRRRAAAAAAAVGECYGVDDNDGGSIVVASDDFAAAACRLRFDDGEFEERSSLPMSASSSVSVSDCSGGGGEPATVDDVSLCAVTKPRRHAGDDVGASSPSAAVEANTTFTLLPELGDAPADGLRLSGRACADTVNTQTARVSTDNWGKCASGAADNVDFDGDIITLINNINNNNDGVTFSGVTVDCRSGGVFDANVNVVRPTPGVDVFKVPLAAGATDKPRCTIANVLPMVAGVVGNSKFHQTMAQSRGEQFIHSSQGFSCVLDELENRSEGGLAPELARNSLYVNFDPILSRPSVAPIVKHLRSARDDTLPASAVPTAIKEDLIAFSPGSSPAAAPPPVCTKQLVDTVGDGLTHDGPSPACLIGHSSDRPQQQPSQGQECGVGCVGEGLVRGLSTCAGGDEEDVCYPMACAQKQHPRQQQPLFADVEKTQQQQQQQEYFQQELQKRDREVVTLQQTVGKLKQQLEAARVAEQKGLSLVDASCRALHLALAELEAARDHCHQQTRQLAEQRDEARAEVVSIEAMFADLHRKYEKSKLMLNEQTCVSEAQSERLKEVLHQVSRETQRHDLLKQYAENAIQKARTDMELARQTHETEALRLSARLQLADNKEVKLAHENHELTALCDELIQKMGASR